MPRGIRQGRRRHVEDVRHQSPGHLRRQVAEREAGGVSLGIEQRLQQQCPVERVAGARGERPLRPPQYPRVGIEPDAVTDEFERGRGVTAQAFRECVDLPRLGRQGGLIRIRGVDDGVDVDDIR